MPDEPIVPAPRQLRPGLLIAARVSMAAGADGGEETAAVGPGCTPEVIGQVTWTRRWPTFAPPC